MPHQSKHNIPLVLLPKLYVGNITSKCSFHSCFLSSNGQYSGLKYTKVSKTREIELPDDKLYRLQVVEKDELVKVRYIGYDSNYDEWRPASDIIDLTKDRKIAFLCAQKVPEMGVI